jgi:hypothetical protein
MGVQTLSLESIYGDRLTTSNSVTKQASRAFAKVGLMPTFFESCEDVSVYAIEAANRFNEGLAFNRLAVLSYEGLVHESQIYKQANAKAKALGLESAIFSTEKLDVKGTFRRIILAIRAALQRFIMAVGNLIKSIVNWVGGQLAKLQTKAYEEYKKANISSSVTGTAVINVTPIRGGIGYMGIAKTLVDALIGAAVGAEQYSGGIGSSGKERKIATPGALADALVKLPANSNVNSYIKEMLSKGKAPSSKVVANILAYGTKTIKPVSMAISAYKDDALAILSGDNLKSANETVKSARKSSAALAKTVSWTERLERSGTAGENKLSKEQVAGLMFSRNIHQFNVGILLNTYSIFLKERGVAYRVIKLRMDAAKKGKKEAEKNAAKK